jgi:integrase
LAAEPDTQDYLVAIQETLARMGEINRLTWEDVDLDRKTVVLYTRKKKGGHLTPRKVPMTTKVYNMLDKRYKNRDQTKAWVFWGRHWSTTAEGFVEGPYKDRKKIMGTLCRKVGVRYFRYHALRHYGASSMERANVPIGAPSNVSSVMRTDPPPRFIFIRSVTPSGKPWRCSNWLPRTLCQRKFSHRVSHRKTKRLGQLT